MPLCAGIVVMVPAFGWGVVAVYSDYKARRDHSRIGPLSWRAAFDPDSYDEEGRGLLRRSRRMAWAFLPFTFLMTLVAHVLCPGDF